MICTAKEALAVAVSEIGYKEKKSNKDLDSKTGNAGSANYTKFARDTKGYWGNKQGFEWCTTFVLYCFCKGCDPDFPENKDAAFADVKKIQPYTKYGASCKYQTEAYKNAKRWSSTPAVGYQAFFTRGHTGLVEKVEAKRITLIEGNSNNKVERRTYTWPNSIFSGFGMPKYAPEKVEQKPAASTKPSTGTTTKPAFVAYSAKVTPSNGLNVRTGAGTSYKKLGALKCGTTVKVLEEKNGWGRIVYNGKAGWISLNYVKKVN